MNSLTSKAFWFAALERAVKTFAQTLAALIGGGTLVGVTHIDWASDAGLAGTAAALSLLMSLASVSPIVPSITLAPSPEAAPEPKVSLPTITDGEAKEIAQNLVAKTTAPYSVPSELPQVTVPATPAAPAV